MKPETQKTSTTSHQPYSREGARGDAQPLWVGLIRGDEDVLDVHTEAVVDRAQDVGRRVRIVQRRESFPPRAEICGSVGRGVSCRDAERTSSPDVDGHVLPVSQPLVMLEEYRRSEERRAGVQRRAWAHRRDGADAKRFAEVLIPQGLDARLPAQMPADDIPRAKAVAVLEQDVVIAVGIVVRIVDLVDARDVRLRQDGGLGKRVLGQQ